MAKYLIEASYTREGIEGVRSKGGSSRRDAVADTVKSMGGELESFYFAFGEYDAFVIANLLNNQSAAAIALAVNSTGAASIRTTVLLSPEEVDEAAKQSVDYRPPGG